VSSTKSYRRIKEIVRPRPRLDPLPARPHLGKTGAARGAAGGIISGS
jgi:hypothetical protein